VRSLIIVRGGIVIRVIRHTLIIVEVVVTVIIIMVTIVVKARN